MTRNTVLRRADPVTVSTNREGGADLLIGGRWVRTTPHALAVLDVFAGPRRVADAIEALGAHAAGRQHWIDLTRTILELQRKGVLVEASDALPVVAGGAGFATAAAHISLLNDRARTSAMIAAIQDVVRPGDIVVDVGSGCGVLAVAAAQAGATRVFAIEATSAAAAARTLSEANGVSDRVTVIEGWSAHVTLPVRANVLVAEVAGNEPFGSQLLEIILDAQQRLLTPDAALIPRTLRMFAQPVWIDAADLEGVVFTADRRERWREWYGMSFDGLGAECLMPPICHVAADVARRWERVGEAVVLADIELANIREPVIDRTVPVTAAREGRVNAVLGYTELDLAASVSRSSSPYVDQRGAGWTIPVWLCRDPLELAAGSRWELGLSYPGTTGRTTVTMRQRR